MQGCRKEFAILQVARTIKQKYMSGYYVYIMANKRNGTLYIGMSGNLAQRAGAHKKGTASEFTKEYGVKKLVYYERHNDEQKAKIREKQMKRWKRKWKLRLIEGVNPNWKDLSEDLDKKDVWVPAPCLRIAGAGYNMQGFRREK